MNPRKKSTSELEQEREINRQNLETKRNPLYVIAENIRSLDNVGLLFRLCELARVEKLFLCGLTGRPMGDKNDRRPAWEIERNDRRIRKTAIYAVPYQPWEYRKNSLAVVQSLKRKAVKIVILEQTTDSINYSEANYSLPLALVLGHERLGVSEKVLRQADLTVEIPIYGLGNSHNVALAAGIVLYHILNQSKTLVK